MPYAIIRTGGHQEKVSPGEQITVDRLKQEVGQEITWVPLAVSKVEGELVTDHQQLQSSAKVVAKVVQHIKADKVDIFQYRQKTGYRRHTGHRQPMTLVEIASIHLGDETFTAPAPVPEPEPEEEMATKTEAPEKPAEKKAAAKKPEAKKSTAKSTAKATKKAPAKKPAPKKK